MKKVLKQCLFAIVVAAVCLQVCYMCGLFTAEDFFGGAKPEESTPEASTPEQTPDDDEIEEKVYSITYLNAPTNDNPASYKKGESITLTDAAWPGLSFSHWSDGEGNTVEEISAESEDDLTLVANWKYMEDLSETCEDNGLSYLLFNDGLDAYQFIYELGYVHNVVLDELSTFKYNGVNNHTWNISETVSFTDAEAERAAIAVSDAVARSDSWGAIVAKTHELSDSEYARLSFDMYFGAAELSKKMENAFGIKTEEGSLSVKAIGSGEWVNHEKAMSTLTYAPDSTTTVDRTEVLKPGVSPAGMYRFVHAGTVRSFAVVTYDAKYGNYHINIYSYVVGTYETVLYDSIPEYESEYSIAPADSFELAIDVTHIAEKYVGNAYTVEFDANGGSGTMPAQMILPDVTATLYENRFTKEGCSFVGWQMVGNDDIILYEGDLVINLGNPKETVRLKAVWSETAPVWVESDSGSFYFGDIPSTVDMTHPVFKDMKKEAYVAYETETTKRVVTVERVGYVYWHWMYSTKADGMPDRAIYYKKGTGPDNNFYYKYFFAFTSTKGDYQHDRYYCNSQYMTNYIVNDQKTSNAECGGATRWFRFEYYICTYTDYVLSK